jgi:WD40 repeat protein
VSEIAAAVPVDGFALNPYGSMLAYVSFARSEVRGIFLAAQREQLFASLPGLSAAMAFSPDARFLALGAQDGAVHVLDLSTRQQAYTLKPSFFSGKVTSLHPMSAETWLVGYAEHLTLWNASGKQLANAIFNNPPCCVSVDSAQKRVAVGDAHGNLRLYDGNLQEENDYHEVCSGAITRILFSKESDALLVACKDTVFKKLKR